MIYLVIGLILFLGIHSVRILSDNTRTQFISKHGAGAWKGMYSVLSIIGFALLIYGYGQTRLDPTHIWYPPVAMAHIASLLMLIAFIVLTSTYVPGNAIKAKLGHPMTIAVKIWAFAHLLANGRLGDIILFTAFLLWAVAALISAKRRDRAAGINHATESFNLSATSITVVVGIVIYVVFAMWLHLMLIGVSPF